MTHLAVRASLLTLATLGAVAACGGSETSSTGPGSGTGAQFDPNAWGTGGVGDGTGSGTGNAPGSGTGNAPGSDPASAGGVPGTPPPGPDCGNGVLNADEECDGALLGGATCAMVTMGSSPSGTLRCLGNCTFDLTGCTTAGDPQPGSGGATGAGGTTGAGGRTGRPRPGAGGG